MPYVWRLLRPVVLVTLVSIMLVPLAVPTGHAQESGTGRVVIQGTPELKSLVGAVRDAYTAANPDATVEIDPRGGLRGGFDALCTGEVDVVMSTEPITDEQIAACAGQGQDFVETVLAYEAVALLATPQSEVTCADQPAVEQSWQLGSAEEVNWTTLGSALDAPVAFYGPDNVSPAYLLFKNLMPAGDLRADITSLVDPQALLDKVAEDGSNAFAFMSLADLERLVPEGDPAPVSIRTEDGGDCIPPTLASLAARTYPFARTDYLYVNAASAQRAEVQAFMQFALNDPAGVAAVASDQGYTQADTGTYLFGVNAVTSGTVGRTFSRPISPVSIATTTEGTVTITGTASLYSVLLPIKRDFETKYAAAKAEFTAVGNVMGWDAFCAGEADVISATADPTADQQAACEANGVDAYTIDLGHEALVLAVPAAADWVTCADKTLVSTLLNAGTTDAPAVTNWNQVNPDYPDRDLLLVAPPFGTGETDYLTTTLIGDLNFPVRDDMTISSDPLYRAQGVANTDNGLTYLWWSDMQKSTSDAKLLEVDGGSGCVAPTLDTVLDGSYPLSFPARLVVNRAKFDNGLLRAYLWHLFDDSSITAIEATGYAGLDVAALKTSVREEVYQMLSAYEAEHPAVGAAETTGTPTPEATEIAPEATATGEPTAAVEPTATAEPTVEPAEAPSATPEPTATTAS